MNGQPDNDGMIAFIDEYIATVEEGFTNRWSQVTPSIYANHVHQCIGGLMARQATLSIEFAKMPSAWNGHVAPLFLRCMVDAFITLAWILEEPDDRSAKYVEYGLGQEKLFIEYLSEAASVSEDKHERALLERTVEMRRGWLEAQRAKWATEVNVGSWSGMSTREMAKAIDRESIYKYAYVPFSGAAHNMWQHVGVYNMKACTNPLHKCHLVPSIMPAPVDVDYLYRSAKYVALTYELVDSKLNTSSDIPFPDNFILNHRFFSEIPADAAEE